MQSFCHDRAQSHGAGCRIALMDEGEWESTGKLRIDRKLALRILQNTEHAERDAKAHTFEHSPGVQIPFIVHFSADVAIVSIAVLSATYDQCVGWRRGCQGDTGH